MIIMYFSSIILIGKNILFIVIWNIFFSNFLKFLIISYPSNILSIFAYDARLKLISSKFIIKEDLYDTLGEIF